jgi:hypothetical protein
MSEDLERVKRFLSDLDLEIINEDVQEELVVVRDVDNCISYLIIDCERPIVILEQLVMRNPDRPGDLHKRLLQMNRSLVHGAFVIDDEEKYVFFRDTLQIESLDRNELEGSIRALSLALAEHSEELLRYAGGV